VTSTGEVPGTGRADDAGTDHQNGARTGSEVEGLRIQICFRAI
jgi:hypothetical protein